MAVVVTRFRSGGTSSADSRLLIEFSTIFSQCPRNVYRFMALSHQDALGKRASASICRHSWDVLLCVTSTCTTAELFERAFGNVLTWLVILKAFGIIRLQSALPRCLPRASTCGSYPATESDAHAHLRAIVSVQSLRRLGGHLLDASITRPCTGPGSSLRFRGYPRLKNFY